MNYQVLARKWRPHIFEDLMGQSHVLKPILNALKMNKLHHAYLFTGTRGVGKTTIARIFAKSINCEAGITTLPCNQCSICQDIDAGCFSDLIEVDAASKTKVEDTRELLENIHYAPVRGRFKVYLIDEVHMLSNHSFNALLKTLEEPPAHVKFLLATTDAHKLPITILSRCLKFHLKKIPLKVMVSRLEKILIEEKIEFELPALTILSRMAEGSLRDALSLTEQAIAYCQEHLTAELVGEMLGVLDTEQIFKIVEYLMANNAADLLAHIDKIHEKSVNYELLIDDLLNILHQMAIAQIAPAAIYTDQYDKRKIQALAQKALPEDIQLFYQSGLIGRKDLAFSPDFRMGFEMILLRMLAFQMQPVASAQTSVSSQAPAAATEGGGRTNQVTALAEALLSENVDTLNHQSATSGDSPEKK
ncbi:MAG: DNA polymerase III subunit gamma/tau [Endozoicomonadaceae bacterium]|nr:DNA polymerase III subunit gamma/tau [Endozoicomonadaceae bacterium]